MSNKTKKNKNNEDAYDKRINQGILPTIKIKNHTFYVDLIMDKLRPKDDFMSKGISFSEIEDYYNEEQDVYIIPYNPQKKELGIIDYETIIQIPEDLLVVQLPSKERLDPMGWNRLHGYELKEGLKNLNFRMNFKAKTRKWDDLYVPQKIRENLESLKNSNSKGLKL